VAAHGIARPGWPGFLAGLVVLLVPGVGLGAIIAITIAALSLALRAKDLKGELARAGALLLGIGYVFGCWRCALELRQLNPYWLFVAIALNWAGDSAAMYAGKAFGRHKLAPVISPGKTWEGSIASVAGSVVFALAVGHFALPAASVWLVALVATLANIAGQVGDLSESVLKRGAGIKDSGNMLPGHGGWLDRVDSTLFAVPVAYGLLLLAAMAKLPY
jgi:phosphatidate cytidylyltransferase